MIDLISMLTQMWGGINQASQLPSDMAATTLSKVGDPDALVSLFPDVGSWSPYAPTQLGPELTPPEQSSGVDWLNGPVPMPQIPGMPGSGGGYPGTPGINPSAEMPLPTPNPVQRPPTLSPDQMKQLLGLMPKGEDQRFPAAPAPGRPTGYNGNMMQLGLGARQGSIPRPPTLSELIYGRR